jgi:hypothetical protein
MIPGDTVVTGQIEGGCSFEITATVIECCDGYNPPLFDVELISNVVKGRYVVDHEEALTLEAIGKWLEIRLNY